MVELKDSPSTELSSYVASSVERWRMARTLLPVSKHSTESISLASGGDAKLSPVVFEPASISRVRCFSIDAQIIARSGVYMSSAVPIASMGS